MDERIKRTCVHDRRYVGRREVELQVDQLPCIEMFRVLTPGINGERRFTMRGWKYALNIPLALDTIVLLAYNTYILDQLCTLDRAA